MIRQRKSKPILPKPGELCCKLIQLQPKGFCNSRSLPLDKPDFPFMATTLSAPETLEFLFHSPDIHNSGVVIGRGRKSEQFHAGGGQTADAKPLMIGQF
jgi:hypothetical protein